MRKEKSLRAAGFGATALLLASMVAVPAPAKAAEPVRLGQGWSAAEWVKFYGTDQGSRIMPLDWILALKQPNGQPFLADNLSRYGYLPNPDSDPPGLPVGFNVASQNGVQTIGMTCAACHTRQINAGGTAYRIDGGPAFTDLQGFFADLDTAVGTAVNDAAAFSAFAKSVIGLDATPDQEKALHQQVADWYLLDHTLMTKSLAGASWGPVRADAVSMIFNRLTGLDIGAAPNHLLAENIFPATAPVRYPFIWNAPKQDKTQWPGFAANGDNLLGLARNLGEVFGVFGAFHPYKTKWKFLGIDYVGQNSGDWEGLDTLENLAASLQPPKWPSSVKYDPRLAAKGKEIFAWTTAQGGCVECHGIAKGMPRLGNVDTWKTPVIDVGTDSKEWSLIADPARLVNPGVLTGACIPGAVWPPLGAKESGLKVLTVSVLGSILQHYSLLKILPAIPCRDQADMAKALATLQKQIDELKDAFTPQAQGAGAIVYESRVMEGIWAAAPYLHNGSVPTLADLLKPAAQRPTSFKVGPDYDLDKVGLAATQSKFNFTYTATGCGAGRNSGNSNCGHEYGTSLSPENKQALLEYLKTL